MPSRLDRARPQLIDMSLSVGHGQYRVEIVGGEAAMADRARARLAELSRLWDETIQTSDLARLASNGPRTVAVTPETLLLLSLAQYSRCPAAGDLQPGSPDPLRLDFVELTVRHQGPMPDGLVRSSRSLVPAVSTDIVVAELSGSGAWGGYVAVGRVVRAFGLDADGATRTVRLTAPTGDRVQLDLSEGAVATASQQAHRHSSGAPVARPEDVVWAAATAATASQAQLIADELVCADPDAQREQLTGIWAHEATVLRRDGTLVTSPVSAA